jgi:hypothetical protein
MATPQLVADQLPCGRKKINFLKALRFYKDLFPKISVSLLS